MANVVLLGLFAPLIGFIILFGSSNTVERRTAGSIACSAILIAFLCFASLLVNYVNHAIDPMHLSFFKWIPIQGIDADFSLHLDSLSLLMTLIITGVGFLIHVYSTGYMDHEADYARYFACLNFFVFSMLLLVLAGNLLLLFVGWEGVGLASYLLIGFWYQRPSAAQAATKAFVVNRIGDWGLLVGLLLTFALFGTSDIPQVLQSAVQSFPKGAPILGMLTLLYFIGATGKSAQLPLQVWLPDAMEGPTPVSALIHAATMVTAGVYLVVRMHPIFQLAPETLHWIAYVGVATALFAALCAVGQTDLKRVLAYSTVSQLGFMFLACGVGAFYAAMFHLTMHAFVKALLFLSAGNVVHMLHGTTDMNKMGGLAKIFPETKWLFLIGVLALSGVPPLAAFFSKDLILEQDYLAGFKVLFWLALATSTLTAFYLMRAYCLTFTGPSRLDEKMAKIAKEAPSVMIVPVSVLALLSILGGFLGFALNHSPVLQSFLAQSDIQLAVQQVGFHFSSEMWLSLAGALIGIGAAIGLYGNATQVDRPLAILRKSFYIDEIYDKLIVYPLKAFSWIIVDTFETKVIEGVVDVSTGATQGVARQLQRLQSGQIRSYVAWMVIGAVLLIVYFVF